MHAVAQRLSRAGVRMEEYPQSVPNLTEASQNPLRTDPGAQPCGYPNDAIRLAISRAVAAEPPRGWRIAKDKQSHKIDVVVALAMAALSALRSGADDYYSSLEWVASPAELGRTRRSLWEHPSILGW
jgi:hypothetical protein